MTRILSLAALLSLTIFPEPAWACCKNRRRCVVFTPVYCAPMTPVPKMPPADEVFLRLNLEVGRKFYQESETFSRHKMKVAGQELSQDQSQTFVIQWTPLGKDEEGCWQLRCRLVGVKMKIDIGGNKNDFDSEADGPQNPLSDFFRRLKDLELLFTFDPDNRVVKIQGRQQFLDKEGSLRPQMKPLMEKILAYEGLKEIAETTFAQFPNWPVRPGAAWTRISKLDLGPIGIYRTTYDYRYEGRSGAFDKISVKSNVSYQRPANTAGVPFKIKHGSLKGKGTGEVVYDNGRIASSTITTSLQGDLIIAIAGVDTDVTIEQTQTVRSKITDHHPWRTGR